MSLDKFWELLNKFTEEEFLQESYEFDKDPEEVADLFDCKVIRPEPNQLQIDIDCESQYNFFRGRLNDLESIGILCVIKMEEHPSKSGLPKRHITLTCGRDFLDAERVAIQFALGSDIIRETLNTIRLIDSGGTDSGSLFFEKINNEEEKESE